MPGERVEESALGEVFDRATNRRFELGKVVRVLHHPVKELGVNRVFNFPVIFIIADRKRVAWAMFRAGIGGVAARPAFESCESAPRGGAISQSVFLAHLQQPILWQIDNPVYLSGDCGCASLVW